MDNKNNYEYVKKMYEDFTLIDDTEEAPKLIPDNVALFRLRALSEELEELEDGYKELDLSKIADALVDLVVFAMGTATLHHLPWEELFADVQRANTSKVVQFTDQKDRNGGGSIDLVKPAGWEGPKTEEILKKHGWTSQNG